MKTKYADMDRMNGVFDGEDEGPIAIVNLLKFYADARYPQDAPEYGNVNSGRDAYHLYAKAFMELMADKGAHTAYYGDAECYIIGNGEWDAVWINHFPSRAAFKSVRHDPRYKEMYRHREAGLDYQEAIVTRPGMTT